MSGDTEEEEEMLPDNVFDLSDARRRKHFRKKEEAKTEKKIAEKGSTSRNEKIIAALKKFGSSQGKAMKDRFLKGKVDPMKDKDKKEEEK